MKPRPRAAAREVLIVGSRGEFGRFLRHDILPRLGIRGIPTADRETSGGERRERLRRAHDVVLATPLAGYAELARELVLEGRRLDKPTTFWLIPSVQAGVWRAVTAALEEVGNPYLSVVFVHPMYGPNGFRATESEARTFRNILTAVHEGARHPLADELAWLRAAFSRCFNIGTTDRFTPEEHDRITACSQGLSYCVARLMFERPDLDARVAEHLPGLQRSFHANRQLIHDFIRLNGYMPHVAGVFSGAWQQTSRATCADLLQAFAVADAELNAGGTSAIPTKWYAQLRAAGGGRGCATPGEAA